MHDKVGRIWVWLSEKLTNLTGMHVLQILGNYHSRSGEISAIFTYLLHRKLCERNET